MRKFIIMIFFVFLNNGCASQESERAFKEILENIKKDPGYFGMAQYFPSEIVSKSSAWVKDKQYSKQVWDEYKKEKAGGFKNSESMIDCGKSFALSLLYILSEVGDSNIEEEIISEAEKEDLNYLLIKFICHIETEKSIRYILKEFEKGKKMVEDIQKRGGFKRGENISKEDMLWNTQLNAHLVKINSIFEYFSPKSTKIEFFKAKMDEWLKVKCEAYWEIFNPSRIGKYIFKFSTIETKKILDDQKNFSFHKMVLLMEFP